jgi:hypothetical protein
MTNPTYQVNISYYPARVSGRQLVNTGGVTYSTLSYSDGYFIASMPELKITATGTGYVDALNNVLAIATASENPGYNPLSNIRTW